MTHPKLSLMASPLWLWCLPAAAVADGETVRVGGSLTLAVLGIWAIANGCRCLARNRRRNWQR
jgi:hypothetical protein